MESIRESYVNTVNELNQELLILKKQCEEYDTQNQVLTDELEKRPAPINEESVEPNATNRQGKRSGHEEAHARTSDE